MQPEKDQLEYIQDEALRFGSIDPVGNVVFVSTPVAIPDSPEGWDDEAIQYIRNPVLFGLFRSMSATLIFKKASAKIMRWLYYTLGIQAIARYSILRRNNFNTYEGYYSGTPDFSQTEDGEEGFKINLMEGGITELIKANQATTYEIPLDVPEAVTVAMDGAVMRSELTLTSYRDSQLDINGIPVPIPRNGRYINMGVFLTAGETTYPSVQWNAFTSYLSTDNLADVYNWQSDWIHFATADSANTMVAALPFEPPSSHVWECRLYIKNEKNGATRFIVLDTSAGPEIGVINIDASYALVDGERAWLILYNPNLEGVTFFRPTPLPLPGQPYIPVPADYPIACSYTYRHPTSLCKVFYPLYVLDFLIKKISNGQYGVSSSLLLDPLRAKNFCITCGDAIRGLVGATIKTSLDEFFKSLNTRFNVGLGVDLAGVIFEEKNHFFNNNNLVDIGEVADCVLSPYLEAIPNNIKIGWPNQSSEVGDPNGRDEFNTTFEWSTPITKHAKELNLVSAYRADFTGIEKLRTNLEGKTTTDNNSDNDTFMLNIAERVFIGNVNFNSLVQYTITTFGRFQSVFPGSKITVSGTGVNDGVYTVISVVQGVGATIQVQEPVIDGNFFGITITSDQAALNRPIYDSLTGVFSPSTVFNTELRPGLCLRAHGDYIRAGMDKLDGKFLKFQTTDKNANLAVTSGGVTIVEKADVQIGSLVGKLYLPVMALVTVRVPLNIKILIEADPYGQIKFKWNGVDMWGFIMEAGQHPDMNESQVYKLLLSTRNDLSKQITF